MPGRHRFAGEDRTVRPLLATVVPVVAVMGMTVAAFMGGVSPATSTARIEVPRFAGGPDGTSAPAVTTAALPSALPQGVPMIMNISASGSSAVQRISDERAQAAEQAREARAAAAAEAARAREASEAARRLRAAQARPAPAAPAAPAPTTDPTPSTTAPKPSTTPSPNRSTPQDRTGSSAPAKPRGLLDSLLGGRGN